MGQATATYYDIMTGGAAANGGHGGISGYGSQYDLYFDQNKLPINQHHNNSSSASNGAPEYLTIADQNYASDKEKRNVEHRAYKEFQANGYLRTGDPCRDLKNRIEFYKELANKKEAWDRNWHHQKSPRGRYYYEIQQMRKDIKEWEDELKNVCGDYDF
ncbi:hypothetical protein [Gynuella sp.]|uniref:hypothetical protein n=1 Tax=Gynuella sp. TaxID=2969146 RepID=UPI003D1327AB